MLLLLRLLRLRGLRRRLLLLGLRGRGRGRGAAAAARRRHVFAERGAVFDLRPGRHGVCSRVHVPTSAAAAAPRDCGDDVLLLGRGGLWRAGRGRGAKRVGRGSGEGRAALEQGGRRTRGGAPVEGRKEGEAGQRRARCGWRATGRKEARKRGRSLSNRGRLKVRWPKIDPGRARCSPSSAPCGGTARTPRRRHTAAAVTARPQRKRDPKHSNTAAAEEAEDLGNNWNFGVVVALSRRPFSVLCRRSHCHGGRSVARMRPPLSAHRTRRARAREKRREGSERKKTNNSPTRRGCL